MLQELEEGGTIVPEARYFPYRATIDFECYFNKENALELRSTHKLNWESAHVPLSVSAVTSMVMKQLNVFKAYKCEPTKGFFPYQWLDCLDK